MSNDLIFLMCFGFFSIGVIVGGWFASIFIKALKEEGYLKFEITEKFHKQLK